MYKVISNNRTSKSFDNIFAALHFVIDSVKIGEVYKIWKSENLDAIASFSRNEKGDVVVQINLF